MAASTGLRCFSAQAPLLAVFAFVLLVQPTLARADSEALETRARRGPVEAVLRLTPAHARMGDSLELELLVQADPGVEILMPEFGDALGRFRIIDFAPSRDIGPEGDTISRQHYTLAPALSGAQRVPPLLIEFVDHRPGHSPTPEGEDAYELLTDALDFEVASMLGESEPLELEPALGALGPLRQAGPWWPWLAAVVGALLAAAAIARVVTLLGRRRGSQSAYAAARSELDALLYGPRPDAAHMDTFFVNLSGIVRRYIERRFGLHSPELTTEEFLAELRHCPDLLRSHQTLLADFLGIADLVKFARLTPEATDVNRSIEAARRFLEATREAEDAPVAPPIEDGEAAGV